MTRIDGANPGGGTVTDIWVDTTGDTMTGSLTMSGITNISFTNTGNAIFSQTGSDLYIVGSTITVIGSPGNLELNDAVNVVLGTTTGTKIGTSTSQKLGFYNVTPVIQPTAYTQTYSTSSKTQSAVAFTGAISGTPTQVTPWGYASAQIAGSVLQELNKLGSDVIVIKNVLNSVIDDLQSLGLLAT